MFVLAIDTSTPAVTVGVVELTDVVERTVAARVTVDARRHAELVSPQISACLAAAGLTPADLDAVVVGVGPGPFTGLRVGMATGAAFADALSIPVYPVCSLDAIAVELGHCDALIVTDARRREVYWARYSGGRRIEGPSVGEPRSVDPGAAEVVAGSASHVDLFDLPVEPLESPAPLGLVRAARTELLAARPPQPLVPMYLRRPDATPAVASS